MSIPIVFVLMILFAVSAAFYVFSKYINLSDRTARKIEIVGYVLLIVIIVWEFIVKNILMSEFYLSESVYTVEKLNRIYTLLFNLCQHFNIDTPRVSDFFDLEHSDYLNLQLLTTSIIEAILQILSAIFIAIGRFQELKKNKQ